MVGDTMMAEERKPIFILWARSFWAGLLTVILALSTVDDATAASVGAFIGTAVGGDVQWWTTIFRNLPPVLTMLFALQQRAGAARPYTLNPMEEGALE